jgi:hypothetical protein
MVEAKPKAFDFCAIQLIAGRGYLSTARRSPGPQLADRCRPDDRGIESLVLASSDAAVVA